MERCSARGEGDKDSTRVHVLANVSAGSVDEYGPFYRVRDWPGSVKKGKPISAFRTRKSQGQGGLVRIIISLIF